MRQLKQLSLLLGLLLLGPSTYAQSVRFQSQAISTRGAGIANATVAICSQPANTNTQPCSPLATLATSTITTSGGANPLTADSFGNFFFYAAPGRYTVQIYGPAVSGQFVTPDVEVTSTAGGSSGAFSSLTVSGTGTLANIDGYQYVDGVTNITVQQAINKLPAAGGTVYIPCGTYAGPSAASYTTGLRLISLCGKTSTSSITGTGGQLSYSAANVTTLQYPSGLNISSAANLTFDNVIFDMQSNATANMTLTSVSGGTFPHMAVINCGSSGPCLTITTLNQANANSTLNSFGDLILQGGTIGLDLTTPTAGTSFSTNNNFVFLQLLFPTSSGILFDKWCDSNTFLRVSQFYSGNVAGLTLNGSTTTAQGVQDEYISWFDMTGSGNAGAKALVVNPSIQNYIRLGILGGMGTAPITYNNPSTIPTTIAFDDVGGQLFSPNTQGMWWPQVVLNTPNPAGSPSLYFSQNAVTRWQQYLDGSLCMNWFSGGANRFAICPGTTGMFIETAGAPFSFAEGAAPAGSANNDVIYGDSTAHAMPLNYNNGGITNFLPKTIALTADWTCGTGGTVASCTSATIIGSGGGVPLTFNLPLAANSFTLECNGAVTQATAVTANQWNLLTATNGATNVTATYDMFTAAAAPAAGAVTDQASTTTTFQIAPSWTLGATGTKMPFHIWAKVEGASASGTVLSLQLLAPTVGDLVTIYRGTSCRIF